MYLIPNPLLGEQFVKEGGKKKHGIIFYRFPFCCTFFLRVLQHVISRTPTNPTRALKAS